MQNATLHHLDIHYALDVDAAKAYTEFGQPRLGDYGADDLSGYRDDLVESTPVVTVSRPVTMTAVVAVVDLDAPANALSEVRPPDFYDDGRAVWIGPDGAVSVPHAQLRVLERLVGESGFHARSGRSPREFGVEVHTYAEDFAHPGVSTNRDRACHSQWRAFTDALTQV